MRLMVSGSDSPTKTRWSDRGISTYVPCRYLVAVVRGTRGSTVLSDSAPMASTGVVPAAKSTDAALARSSHGNAISQYTRPNHTPDLHRVPAPPPRCGCWRYCCGTASTSWDTTACPTAATVDSAVEICGQSRD